MIGTYNQESYTKVYHKKYGTALVIEKEGNPNFINAADDTIFTCYRIGHNNWIYQLKAYSFPKKELTLKPEKVINQIG